MGEGAGGGEHRRHLEFDRPPHPTLPPPGKVDMHSGQVACRTAFTFPYQREATFTYRYQP
jgi:hypothetical protein